MNSWMAIRLDGEDLEDKLWQLADCGCLGSQVNEDGTASCYFPGQFDRVPPKVQQTLGELGLTAVSISRIADKNWTQACEALLEPIELGKFKVVPLSGLDAERPAAGNDQILIIPGTGFGTGHHSTTAQLLELMQHPQLAQKPPHKVLDAGTGSGILAIAACKIFACTVDAYEVDSLALENAHDNVRLNRLEDCVVLLNQSVHQCTTRYELVIANLYAELLEMLCGHLVERADTNCHWLLSGIRADLLDAVKEKYCSHGLKALEQSRREGWGALLLSKS